MSPPSGGLEWAEPRVSLDRQVSSGCAALLRMGAGTLWLSASGSSLCHKASPRRDWSRELVSLSELALVVRVRRGHNVEGIPMVPEFLMLTLVWVGALERSLSTLQKQDSFFLA